MRKLWSMNVALATSIWLGGCVFQVCHMARGLDELGSTGVEDEAMQDKNTKYGCHPRSDWPAFRSGHGGIRHLVEVSIVSFSSMWLSISVRDKALNRVCEQQNQRAQKPCKRQGQPAIIIATMCHNYSRKVPLFQWWGENTTVTIYQKKESTIKKWPFSHYGVLGAQGSLFHSHECSGFLPQFSSGARTSACLQIVWFWATTQTFAIRARICTLAITSIHSCIPPASRKIGGLACRWCRLGLGLGG